MPLPAIIARLTTPLGSLSPAPLPPEQEKMVIVRSKSVNDVHPGSILSEMWYPFTTEAWRLLLTATGSLAFISLTLSLFRPDPLRVQGWRRPGRVLTTYALNVYVRGAARAGSVQGPRGGKRVVPWLHVGADRVAVLTAKMQQSITSRGQLTVACISRSTFRAIVRSASSRCRQGVPQSLTQRRHGRRSSSPWLVWFA